MGMRRSREMFETAGEITPNGYVLPLMDLIPLFLVIVGLLGVVLSR